MFTHLIGVDAPTYARLIDGRRVKGSLGLVDGDTLDFHPWNENVRETYEYVRLRHGRACVSKNRIRLYIDLDRAEKVDPISSIYSDTYDAMSFIREELKPKNDKDDEQKHTA